MLENLPVNLKRICLASILDKIIEAIVIKSAIRKIPSVFDNPRTAIVAMSESKLVRRQWSVTGIRNDCSVLNL
jgi:hypothetical protein